MPDDDQQARFATILSLAEQLPIAAQSRLIAALATKLAEEIAGQGVRVQTEQHNGNAAARISEPVRAIDPLAAEVGVASADAAEPVHEQDTPAPLRFVHDSPAFPWIDILPNGIDAASGQPLLVIDAVGARAFAVKTSDDDELQQLHQARASSDSEVLGLVHGRSYDQLHEAGWAIVVSIEDEASLLTALEPLIAHRCREQGLPVPDLTAGQGETCGAWLARQGSDMKWPMRADAALRLPIFTYRPGERCSNWLARYNVSARPVDPARGVPFYLLLVGRPGPLSPADLAYIPFEFQYQLDLFWGVGRLCFTDDDGHHDLAAYTAYAAHVVAYEREMRLKQRRIVYFAPEHDLDRATQASVRELVRPLAEGVAGQPSIAAQYGFQQELLLTTAATRSNLAGVLGGGSTPCPDLFFAASHGVGFPATDPRLRATQGALVCQDWTGYGNITREHWFCAEDLAPSADVRGLIAILFGCYSLGCPRDDQFTALTAPPRPIAPHTLVARLPQMLLRQGALAMFGHIDRAWTYSFRGNAPGSARIAYAQTQAFEDLLARMMDGKRMGYATDQFNAQQGATAVELSELLLQQLARPTDDKTDALSLLWAAHNDLRNYALLGDPAVRLLFAAAPDSD